jgi:Flp pilus assembly protein TadB
MTTTLLLLILFVVTIGAAGFALVPSALGNKRAQARMKAFQGDIRANRQNADATRVREDRRKSVQQALKSQTDELNARKRLTLERLIFQAGMTIKPSTFIRNSVIFGAGLFVVLFVAQVPFYFAAISTSCPTPSKPLSAASRPVCPSTIPCAWWPRIPRSRSAPNSPACLTSRASVFP